MNNSEGQTQEPVGGMKWEDVQILAKKHAEQIIEMGWRDNPDKDDIIADFISGYASAPPPTSTEEEKELAELRCWKESAMKVMADMQEIGKELGVKLGESIHDKILPAIINYKKLLTGSPPPDVEALAKDYVKTLKITNRNEIEYAIQDFKAGYSASQKVKNANELFRDDFQAYADRILRDKGASNKDVFDAINDTIQELSKKYNITIVASLPSSSVTGEEDKDLIPYEIYKDIADFFKYSKYRGPYTIQKYGGSMIVKFMDGSKAKCSIQMWQGEEVTLDDSPLNDKKYE